MDTFVLAWDYGWRSSAGAAGSVVLPLVAGAPHTVLVWNRERRDLGDTTVEVRMTHDHAETFLQLGHTARSSGGLDATGAYEFSQCLIEGL